MKFCPQCGCQLPPSAKFCVECGQPLAGAPAPVRLRINKFFAASFAVIIIAGLAITGLLYRQQRRISAARQTAAPSDLPPGHPRIDLPKDVRDLIAGIQAEAERRPNDLAAWDRFGAVTLRAAQFDPTYYPTATDAFAHVLKLAPDDPEALRGIGDIDYDRQQYDQAIAAYEHYLRLRPDDPQVRVDLGTMYLYTGNPDQALALYHKAVALQPGLFEGYFNMGVAYASLNQHPQAQAAFEQAIKIAPDAQSKQRAADMLAKLNGTPPGTPPPPSNPAVSASVVPATDFRGSIESLVRNLPIAGPKVQSIQWPSQAKAVVLMDNFPMDSMPPFVRQRFLQDVSDGIERAKRDYHVGASFQLDIADAQSGRVMETITR